MTLLGMRNMNAKSSNRQTRTSFQLLFSLKSYFRSQKSLFVEHQTKSFLIFSQKRHWAEREKNFLFFPPIMLLKFVFQNFFRQ